MECTGRRRTYFKPLLAVGTLRQSILATFHHSIMTDAVSLSSKPMMREFELSYRHDRFRRVARYDLACVWHWYFKFLR